MAQGAARYLETLVLKKYKMESKQKETVTTVLKCTCCDSKDGELCLNRVKPEESLMEACSDSDVQIDRQIWV